MDVRISLILAAAALLVGGASGCPAPPQDSRFPTRPEGCEVQVFHGPPGVMSDNIGPVMATCGEDIKDEDCLRTLKDQTCKLGGDIVWGVDDVPVMSLGKKKLAGRAAHSKTGSK